MWIDADCRSGCLFPKVVLEVLGNVGRPRTCEIESKSKSLRDAPVNAKIIRVAARSMRYYSEIVG